MATGSIYNTKANAILNRLRSTVYVDVKTRKTNLLNNCHDVALVSISHPKALECGRAGHNSKPDISRRYQPRSSHVVALADHKCSCVATEPRHLLTADVLTVTTLLFLVYATNYRKNLLGREGGRRNCGHNTKRYRPPL